MTDRIDLRSDTVTQPTAAMRAAMAAAPVGDDQYGEDPSTNRLQARCAELLGKQAALWLPTGTMANQVALRTLTRPGDEVVACRESHAAWHEAGRRRGQCRRADPRDRAGRALQRRRAARRGQAAQLRDLPTTTLVEVENTHNRAGGVVVPQAEVLRICAVARELGLATFLDGARLWNASVATGLPLHELAAPFELVAVAFSKGLGAPGGSLLAGPKALIAAADRHRRRMGGAMRQNGIFAAAALHALDHHLEPPGRGPCQRPCAGRGAGRRGAGAAGPGHGADQHRRLPPAGRAAAGCARRSASGRASAACWSMPSERAPCAP